MSNAPLHQAVLQSLAEVYAALENGGDKTTALERIRANLRQGLKQDKKGARRVQS